MDVTRNRRHDFFGTWVPDQGTNKEIPMPNKKWQLFHGISWYSLVSSHHYGTYGTWPLQHIPATQPCKNFPGGIGISYLWKTRNLVPANENDGYPINIPLSMDWLKGTSTGSHRFSHEIWGFPVKFPLIQSIYINIPLTSHGNQTWQSKIPRIFPLQHPVNIPLTSVNPPGAKRASTEVSWHAPSRGTLRSQSAPGFLIWRSWGSLGREILLGDMII